MDTVLIRYNKGKGTIYTWEIHPLLIICFFVGFSIPWISILLYKLNKKNKQKMKKLEIANPRGGTSIEKCIDPDLAYEVIDSNLKNLILHILKENSKSSLPVIISSEVFIFATIVSKTLLQSVILSTVRSFTSGAPTLVPQIQTSVLIMAVVAGMSLGLITGLIGLILSNLIPLNILVAMGVLGTPLLGAILKTQLSVENVNCSKLLAPLPIAPKEIVLPQKTNIFLHDNSGNRLDRPIIVRDSNTMSRSSIYTVDQCIPVVPDWKVTSKYSQTRFWKEYPKYFVGEDTKPELKITKTQLVECNYKPLKDRTKTLTDIRKNDTSEHKEKVQPYIEKYQDRRKNINRQRINEYTAYYDLD